ncbi:MAG: TrkA C-terminal domain-containing protein [Acidobacteriota bacterium]|nr:TrkA C-terminal domain-containing protein [Acidobacteriota bacterium]
MDKITDLLSAGTAETYYIGKGAWTADTNLKDIALREKTGATILAVVRGEQFFTSPGGDFKV